jgi:hypothetical protein
VRDLYARGEIHRRKTKLIKRLDAQRWAAPCP